MNITNLKQKLNAYGIDFFERSAMGSRDHNGFKFTCATSDLFLSSQEALGHFLKLDPNRLVRGGDDYGLQTQYGATIYVWSTNIEYSDAIEALSNEPTQLSEFMNEFSSILKNKAILRAKKIYDKRRSESPEQEELISQLDQLIKTFNETSTSTEAEFSSKYRSFTKSVDNLSDQIKKRLNEEKHTGGTGAGPKM